MPIVFYIAAAVAIIATCRVITALNAVHALLYLIVSLLAVALIFFALGAPFVAAQEVIIYAGAIMVLFVFVIMMLNLGPQATAQERQWLQPKMWRGPAILAMVLIVELIYVLASSGRQASGVSVVEPKQVGIALFACWLVLARLDHVVECLASAGPGPPQGASRWRRHTVEHDRLDSVGVLTHVDQRKVGTVRVGEHIPLLEAECLA